MLPATARALTTLTLALALSIALALELTFLDVGQGSSVLIRTNEGHAVLYDAGERNANVLQMLLDRGVTRLDLLIASHAHADHIGGMSDIIDAIPVTFWMDNGLAHTTSTYERTLASLETAGTRTITATRRTIGLGDTTLTIAPPTNDPTLGQNNNSVGVLIAYHNFRAFLPGDAEPPQWTYWLEQHPQLMQNVDVHLASHHASRNGDTLDAITRLTPTVVIIQSASDNTYGHPHPEALELYDSVNATILRNDLHGTITITVEPDGTYTARIERAP